MRGAGAAQVGQPVCSVPASRVNVASAGWGRADAPAATAALDLASEAAVNRATEQLTARRTTIVVAHRLTTAASADRIVVMNGGRVAEIGTHEDLVAAGGVYADLWEAFTGDTELVA